MATLSEILQALADADIVTDAMVLLRVQRLTDTADALCIVSSDNTGHIVALGMLTKALAMQQADDADVERD